MSVARLCDELRAGSGHPAAKIVEGLCRSSDVFACDGRNPMSRKPRRQTPGMVLSHSSRKGRGKDGASGIM